MIIFISLVLYILVQGMHICLTFIFIDGLLFAHKIWVLRGIALVQVIIIFIMVGVTMFQYKQEAQGLYAELFCFFLCILNVVVIFYYIFINVQLLWLLHSIGPSP